MGRVLFLVFAVSLASRVYSESHTVSFVNNCGFGTPSLVVDQTLVSNGSDYTSDSPIIDAVSYLAQDDCAFGDSETCMEIEINLSNSGSPPSFVAISLMPPQLFRNAACVTFSNGCDGASLACAEADCAGALSGDDDTSDSGTILGCDDENVNIAITFCDCDASLSSSTVPGVIVTSTGGLMSTMSQTATSLSSTTSHLSFFKAAVSSSESSWTTTSQIATSSTATSSSSRTPLATPSSATPTPVSTWLSSSISTISATFKNPSSIEPLSSASPTTSPASNPSTSNPEVSEVSSVEGASGRSHDHTAIIGGVLGGVLAMLALIIAAIIFIRRRRRRALEAGRRRSAESFTSGPPPPINSMYGDKAGHVTSYASISRAASPVVHSPHPQWTAPPETVLDIRSTASDHTRIVETDVSRSSTMSSENPFNLPPLSNLSSFSLLAPPGEEAEVSPVESPVGQRSSYIDAFDPFADAQAVDDPPPRYMN